MITNERVFSMPVAGNAIGLLKINEHDLSNINKKSPTTFSEKYFSK